MSVLGLTFVSHDQDLFELATGQHAECNLFYITNYMCFANSQELGVWH